MAVCPWFSTEQHPSLWSPLLVYLRSWTIVLPPDSMRAEDQQDSCISAGDNAIESSKPGKRKSPFVGSQLAEKRATGRLTGQLREEKAYCIIGTRHCENNPKLNSLGWDFTWCLKELALYLCRQKKQELVLPLFSQ